MRHRFNVGQSVYPADTRVKNPDTYLIVQVLPETSYEPQYRVKGMSSGVECVVCETQISIRQSLTGGGATAFRQADKEGPAQVVWC